MFTKVETNRLQTNDDYKNTVDSLVVRAQVDNTSDQSSVDEVKADFGLYQSQNAVQHPVLREQPQYLLVADKRPCPTNTTTTTHNLDLWIYEYTNTHTEVEDTDTEVEDTDTEVEDTDTEVEDTDTEDSEKNK